MWGRCIYAKNISKRIERIHNSQVECDKDLFEQFVNEEIAKATSISENLLYKDEKSRFEPMIKSGSKGKKQKAWKALCWPVSPNSRFS